MSVCREHTSALYVLCISPVTGMVVGGTEGRQLLIGSSISVSGVRQQAGQACRARYMLSKNKTLTSLTDQIESNQIKSTDTMSDTDVDSDNPPNLLSRQPRREAGVSDVSPCLESQGWQFDPTLIYLLFCSSAWSCCSLSPIPFCFSAHSPDIFFPKPAFSER